MSNIINPYPALQTGQFIGYIGSDVATPNGGASVQLTPGISMN